MLTFIQQIVIFKMCILNKNIMFYSKKIWKNLSKFAIIKYGKVDLKYYYAQKRVNSGDFRNIQAKLG